MSTNPRGRDMVRETPYATRAAILPALPPAKNDFERAAKEILEARGTGPNPFERWLTRRELAELGLVITGGVEDTTPRDVLGVPVWVGRGRFVPVSLTALATSLQALLTNSDEAQSQDMLALRRRVAAIQPGVSEGRLASALNTAIDNLRRQLRAELAAVVQEDPTVQDIASTVQQTAQQAQTERSRRIRFNVAATEWTVTHNLRRWPQVTVVNEDKQEVLPDIVHTSANVLVVTHGRAMTGWVIVK